MNFIDHDSENHSMTTIVSVNEIRFFELPEEDSRYTWRQLNLNCSLYDVHIECTGIQADKNDVFPITLYFSTGVTMAELNDIKKYYEIGKLIKVTGFFYLSTKPWNMTIFNPRASLLSAIAIKSCEETMGETYLPQKTYEWFYRDTK